MLSVVLSLFTNLFLLIKLKYELLWPLGKDVIEGKYMMWGLKWLAFQVCSVILYCYCIGHCFPYEHVLWKKNLLSIHSK